MPPSERRNARAARVGGAAVVAAAMLVLWFAFAGTISWHELVAGAAASAVAAYAWSIAARQGGPGWRGRARWFAEARRLPRAIVADTWHLLVVLARHLVQGRTPASLIVAVPFDPGGDDARSATRRALAIAYTGASPGTVVIGIDPDRRVMLVHHAWHGARAPVAEALGAES